MSEHITDILQNLALNADTTPETRASITHVLRAMAPKGQETIYNTDNPFNTPPVITPVVIEPVIAPIIEITPIIVPAAIIGADQRIKHQKLPTPAPTRANTIGDFPVTGIIYGIRCITTDKWYVGKTQSHTWNHKKYRPFGTRRRWLAHQSECLKANSKGDAPRLKQEIATYGVGAFEEHTLELCDPADKNNREQYWINEKQSYVNGLNATTGGDCGPTSAEHRAKLSAATFAAAERSRVEKYKGKIMKSVAVTWHECATNYYWVRCITVEGEKLDGRLFVTRALNRVQLIAKIRVLVAHISNPETIVDIRVLEAAH